MAVYSGKGGLVLGFGDVGRWRMEIKAATTSVPQSDTGLWKATYVGALTLSGEFEAFGHSHPTPGQQVALQLATGGGRTYIGQAVIESVEVEVDIESGLPVKYRARFSAHGAWSWV